MWSWRLVIFSVYPSLFGVFVSSFSRLPECPKFHKPSMTQLSFGFHAWIKLDFYSNILDNQSCCCDWFLLMYNFQWCGITCNDRSKKKLFYFEIEKVNWKKVFSTFDDRLMNKFWFMNRLLYFYINVHAEIEKLIAKNKSITWNVWTEINLKTSFGVKCGAEYLALLSVYMGSVSPNWPNATNTLKKV